MSKFNTIKYNNNWINIYIVVGLFCLIIFLIGGYILNDYYIYAYSILAILPIYIGFTLKKILYAKVSPDEIIVFGLWGQIKKHYQLKPNEKFTVKNNRIYVLKTDKFSKVKMNSWFVNKYDWQNVIEMFDRNQAEKITKHLIND